jgi:hypothetical protein
MPRQPRSFSQFGDDDDGFVDSYRAKPLDVDSPMSLGSSTTGSFQQRTAWRTPRGGQMPLSYSRRTSGTTFKFDDDASPSMPRSDKGEGK